MTTDRSPSPDERDDLLDLGRQDIILLADRCERAEELVRVLGEALEPLAVTQAAHEALTAYRAFTEANPTPGSREETSGADC